MHPEICLLQVRTWHETQKSRRGFASISFKKRRHLPHLLNGFPASVRVVKEATIWTFQEEEEDQPSKRVSTAWMFCTKYTNFCRNCSSAWFFTFR